MWTTIVSALKGLGGHLIAAAAAKIWVDGNKEKGLREDVERKESPAQWMDYKDEAIYNGLLSSFTGADEWLQTVMENFGAWLNFNHLGRSQRRADMIITFAKQCDAEVGMKNEALALIRRIASEPTHENRVHLCVGRQLMRRHEYSYLMGLIEHVAGRTFDSLRDGWNWLTEVPPAGTAPRWQTFGTQLQTWLRDEVAQPIDQAVDRRLAGRVDQVGSVAHSRFIRGATYRRRVAARTRLDNFRWWNPTTW